MMAKKFWICKDGSLSVGGKLLKYGDEVDTKKINKKTLEKLESAGKIGEVMTASTGADAELSADTEAAIRAEYDGFISPSELEGKIAEGVAAANAAKEQAEAALASLKQEVLSADKKGDYDAISDRIAASLNPNDGDK